LSNLYTGQPVLIAFNLVVEVRRTVPTNTPIFQSDVYVHGLNIDVIKSINLIVMAVR